MKTYKFQWPNCISIYERNKIKLILQECGIKVISFNHPLVLKMFCFDLFPLRTFFKIYFFINKLFRRKRNEILYNLVHDENFHMKPILIIKEEESIALFLLIKDNIINKSKYNNI